MRWIGIAVLFAMPIGALADGETNASDKAAGKQVFSQTCIACHGANGKGTIPGVKDFNASDGPLSKDDETLIASITNGVQTPGAPLAMPAKGGNPGLSGRDIRAVLAYLRATFSSAETTK